MKKTFFFAAVCAALLILVSCGNKPMIDECGCYMNLMDAQKAANKSGKDILTIITSNGDDYASADFIDNVIKSQEFQDKIASDYVIFHADFSQVTFEKTTAPETASKKEKKAAEDFSDLVQTAYEYAVILEVEVTPSVYLVTKDGYVISQIDYDDANPQIMNVDSFAALIASYREKADAYNALVAATEKGSKLEKVQAIDTLFNSTEQRYQQLLYPLASRIPELDPDNKSGVISRYLLISAESEAISLYTEGNVQDAVQCYLKATANKFMEPDQIQEAYFMCAYLVASSGTGDTALIVSYLTSALSVKEDGERADAIRQALDYYTGLSNAALDAYSATENSDGSQEAAQSASNPDEIQLSN